MTKKKNPLMDPKNYLNEKCFELFCGIHHVIDDIEKDCAKRCPDKHLRDCENCNEINGTVLSKLRKLVRMKGE